MVDIEKIREAFSQDGYLTATGVFIDEADEDYAVCSLDIADMHLNIADVVQGGATYTLADSAFAVASNAGFIDRGENRITVNQSASISYFRPPKGKKLIAAAKKISGGKKMSVYSMEVSDDLGVAVALMIGNGYTVDL
jgi:acyl-CoA thioesterase